MQLNQWYSDTPLGPRLVSAYKLKVPVYGRYGLKGKGGGGRLDLHSLLCKHSKQEVTRGFCLLSVVESISICLQARGVC